MKNLKEFKELIERYASITLEEIENADAYISLNKANLLTGFGNYKTCRLCISVNRRCSDCCWCHVTGYICNDDDNKETFEDISDAITNEALLSAFKARAKYMREVLERWENKLNKEEIK